MSPHLADSRVREVAQKLLRRIERRLEGSLQVRNTNHTQALAAWDLVRVELLKKFGIRRADLKITPGDTVGQLRLTYELASESA